MPVPLKKFNLSISHNEKEYCKYIHTLWAEIYRLGEVIAMMKATRLRYKYLGKVK